MVPRTDPRVEDPRKNQYRIRLSSAELAKLNFCSERTGKTKAEIIREGVDLVYQNITKNESEVKK